MTGAATATRYYTTQELAEIFKTTRKSVLGWAEKGYLPAPVRFGVRTCRWNADAIDQFIAENRPSHLKALLHSAAQQATDPQVKKWLTKLLERGEFASSEDVKQIA